MKLSQLISVLVLCLTFSGAVYGQQTIYSKVKVFYEDASEIERLASFDFDLDHPELGKDRSIAFYVDASELEKLRFQGFNFEVVIPDFSAYYAEMLQKDTAKRAAMQRSPEVANGFDLGSMGGFYTFSEVAAKLDEMAMNYPNLVSPKTSIGTSLEGRPIWMVKISDNPLIDEPEPVAYFDALHHAREPLSMAVTINYMFWLLENYDTDPSVQFLVNNRELYFVPVVNPDGYAFNEQTDPNGGGLWRKNRRPDPGGCIGVDLNRNYAFGFNNDPDCSSGNPCSGVYRGTGPFSEPETTAVSNLLAQIGPRTGFSIHSTAGSYLMPYGYDTTPPAFGIYSEWASAFLNNNDYPYGVTFQMLGYTSCGTTRDYMHSEGIYGWTPEIDGSGFWPDPSTIFELVGENVRPLYYQSWIAGAYLDIQSHTQIGDAVPGGSFEMVIEVKNVGVGAIANIVSVILEASVPEVAVSTASSYGTLMPRTRKDNAANPFTITVDPSFQGSSFTITASTYHNGVLNESKVIPVLVGNTNSLFSDNAESGATAWVSSGSGLNWGVIADDSYSGAFSFGDSDGGNAVNNTLNYFELDQSFDLTTTTTPVVTFATKWSIADGDLASFQVSSDGGNNWENLRTYAGNNDWKNEVVILDAYTGFGDVRFRFRLQTDISLPGDGFYFDDFRISDYDTDILGIPELQTIGFLAYPNPFIDGISLKLPKFVSVEGIAIGLVDLSGRRLETTVEKNGNEIRIAASAAIRSGIYFLEVRDKSNSILYIEKMIKK